MNQQIKEILSKHKACGTSLSVANNTGKSSFNIPRMFNSSWQEDSRRNFSFPPKLNAVTFKWKTAKSRLLNIRKKANEHSRLEQAKLRLLKLKFNSKQIEENVRSLWTLITLELRTEVNLLQQAMLNPFAQLSPQTFLFAK